MTLFPEMIEVCLNYSIIKRATEQGIIKIESVNIRDYSGNKHKQVDDTPYGGGEKRNGYESSADLRLL